MTKEELHKHITNPGFMATFLINDCKMRILKIRNDIREKLEEIQQDNFACEKCKEQQKS